MAHINWKKDVFTIPNLLSLLRLALIPVYIPLYINARERSDYILCGMILSLSCLTDAADGFIARNFHMTSSLGRILDPLADKLTQLCLTICLSLRHPQLRLVAGLLVLKEIGQLIGSILLLRRGDPIPSAIPAGKLSTAVLFVSLTALVFFSKIPGSIVTAIALADALLLGYSLLCNFLAYFADPGSASHSGI